MFFPEGQVRVFLYGQPVNMRLSFDGLYALAKHVMHQDPLSGHLFAFVNRRATQIRVLYFDRSGLCVWAKRLEQGRDSRVPQSRRGTSGQQLPCNKAAVDALAQPIEKGIVRVLFAAHPKPIATLDGPTAVFGPSKIWIPKFKRTR